MSHPPPQRNTPPPRQPTRGGSLLVFRQRPHKQNKTKQKTPKTAASWPRGTYSTTYGGDSVAVIVVVDTFAVDADAVGVVAVGVIVVVDSVCCYYSIVLVIADGIYCCRLHI